MTLRISVAQLTDSEAAWDRLAGEDDFYLSHAWLRSVEEGIAGRAEYVLAFDQSTLVGALPLYELARERSAFYAPPRLMQLLGVDGRCLLAGSCRGYRNDWLLDPELPTETGEDIVRALLAAARERAKQRGASALVWPYLTTAGVRRLTNATDAIVILETAEARLDADAGFKAYEASLPGHRRSSVRSEIRRFEEAGWRLSTETLEQSGEALAALVANVERRYGHQSTAEDLQQLLAAQRRHVGDRGVVFVCRDHDATLAAAALCYSWRRALFLRMVGFDYDRLRSAFEYFNLAFYAPLRYMGPQHLGSLHLGIGSLRAKVFRGAVLQPLWVAGVPVREALERSHLREPERLARWRADFADVPGALRADDWTLDVDLNVDE